MRPPSMGYDGIRLNSNNPLLICHMNRHAYARYVPTVDVSGPSRYGSAQWWLIYQNSGHRIAFTSGPHTVVTSHAHGLGGGCTKAIPPSGHSTMCSALPPTARHDSA